MVIDDARVSWRHATISWGGRSWVIEDHGSTNGTYVQGQRIQQMEIGPGSAVHLGNATDGPRLNLSGAGAARRRAAGRGPSSSRSSRPRRRARRRPGRPRPSRRPGSSRPPQQALAAAAAGRSSRAAGTSRTQQGPPVVARGRRRSTATAARPPSTSSPLGRVMRIGRALENELVVSDLQVSRHHAEFHATPDGRFEIRDLG